MAFNNVAWHALKSNCFYTKKILLTYSIQKLLVNEEANPVCIMYLKALFALPGRLYCISDCINLLLLYCINHYEIAFTS